MKRILFTVVYPFWFFLAKTWLGGVLVICLVPVIPALIIGLLLPELMNTTGEEAMYIGQGLVVVSILLSPFVAIPLLKLGWYLESHYDKWNYKIDI